MIKAEQIKSILNLRPHPEEGGYYAETYRSSEMISAAALPNRYGGARSISTAIYYLLTPGAFSVMHRLGSDEIFHFYLGDPIEMVQLWPDGSGKLVTLGTDIANGMRLQEIVPAGVWQGCALRLGGKFGLVGTTVAPGFELADYETGSREALIGLYPRYEERIRALTR